MLALLTVAGTPSIADAQEGAGEWTRKTLRFSLTVRNLRSVKTGDETVFVYGPAATSNQRVVSIESNQTFVQKEDGLGNRALVFSFGELPPFATKRITFTATIDIARKSNVATVPRRGTFDGDEPLIESSHPEIRALGESLGGASAFEHTARVYDWVRNNLVYAGYVADDLGALDAFKTRRGDCSEYAYLLAALNRVRGIPTRVMGGYVLPSSSIVRATDYHNWNEVYLEGKWQLVDAQKGVFLATSDDYVVTRIVSRTDLRSGGEFVHRFSNPEGGLKVDMD